MGMKKKLLAILISLLCLSLICACFAGCKEPEKPKLPMRGSLSFALNEDGTGYLVTGLGNVSSLDIEIPPFHNELPVVGIADMAFTSTGIESVSIPETIETIGDYAFDHCLGITEIKFCEPSSVKTIGLMAFRHCRSLTEITIPSSVETVGIEAFRYCQKIKVVNFNGTFDQWVQIDFADSYGTGLGENGVLYHNGQIVQEVYLESATAIKQNSFVYCNSLKKITIADTAKIEYIGKNAFYNCFSLETIEIPDTVTYIGQAAFYGCNRITSLQFGEQSQLKTIGYKAFFGCTGLKELVLPDSLEELKTSAFVFCTGLEKVVLPNGLKTIGAGAFNSCDSLKEIVLPETLKAIEYSAFQSCYSLTTITIPASVERIGESAFSNCTSLKTIYCKAKSKPSGWQDSWNAFCDANVVWGHK